MVKVYSPVPEAQEQPQTAPAIETPGEMVAAMQSLMAGLTRTARPSQPDGETERLRAFEARLHRLYPPSRPLDLLANAALADGEDHRTVRRLAGTWHPHPFHAVFRILCHLRYGQPLPGRDAILAADLADAWCAPRIRCLKSRAVGPAVWRRRILRAVAAMARVGCPTWEWPELPMCRNSYFSSWPTHYAWVDAIPEQQEAASASAAAAPSALSPEGKQ